MTPLSGDAVSRTSATTRDSHPTSHPLPLATEPSPLPLAELAPDTTSHSELMVCGSVSTLRERVYVLCPLGISACMCLQVPACAGSSVSGPEPVVFTFVSFGIGVQFGYHGCYGYCGIACAKVHV